MKHQRNKTLFKSKDLLPFDNSVTIDNYRILNFTQELKEFELIPEIMSLNKIYFTEMRK